MLSVIFGVECTSFLVLLLNAIQVQDGDGQVTLAAGREDGELVRVPMSVVM